MADDYAASLKSTICGGQEHVVCDVDVASGAANVQRRLAYRIDEWIIFDGEDDAGHLICADGVGGAVERILGCCNDVTIGVDEYSSAHIGKRIVSELNMNDIRLKK